MDDRRRAYLTALGGGALLWLLTAVISGRTEAWDSGLYWIVAYPLAIVLAAGLGYVYPERPWRWGLTVMLAQAVVLAATASGFGLLPLGLLVFAFLALPAIGAARLMARIRIRSGTA